ncbi:MAG: TOBE domain-containing protein [Candidatus Bathyarchaeia archaeon]
MFTQKKHKPSCKIWIEHEGKPIIGKGGAQILEQIEKQKSISKAAKNLGMSYRYVWSYLQKIESVLGASVIETFKGGKSGGGGAKLTALGKQLLDEYRHFEGYLSGALADAECLEALGLKIGIRNRLKGMVKTVDKGDTAAKVKIEIATPTVFTVLISRKAFEDLNIKVGDKVEAVIKATELTITKD